MAEPDDGFHRARISNTLRVVDTSNLTIKTFHAYELECRRPSRFLFHNYTWTGGGIEGAPRIGPSHAQLAEVELAGSPKPRLHGPVIRTEKRERLLLVDMGKMYQRGDRAFVTIEHMFVDTAGTFEKRLSHGATRKPKRVDLSVILPTHNRPVHFIVQHDGSSESVAEKLDPIAVFEDRTQLARYSKIVETPAEGVRYRIEWK
jgi:hypothetical protein